MTEQQQYDQVCKEAFTELSEKLDAIHSRLYIDNGAESIQSKLNRHERWIKGLGWLAGVAASASVATLVTLAVKAIWVATQP